MTVQITIPANPAAIEEGDFHAGIKIYGLEYACSFINGEYLVRNVSGIRYSGGRAKWQIERNAQTARAWLVDQINALGSDFMERHNRLYELEAA